MAIAKIKKLELIGLARDKEGLLKLLQNLGLVELISAPTPEKSPTALPVYSAINLLEVEEAIAFLASFQERVGPWAGMIALKPLVYQQQMDEIIASLDYQRLLANILALRNMLNNLQKEKERLHQERLVLLPWQKLKVPLGGVRPTEKCTVLLGGLNIRDYPNLNSDLAKEHLDPFVEEVNQDKANLYLAILYLQEDFERLEAILKQHHFNFITLPKLNCTVKARILELNREGLKLDGQIGQAKAKVTALSKERFKLMVCYDYWAEIKKRQQAANILPNQKFTFILTGWVRQKDVRLLEREIGNKFKDTLLFISLPQPGEVAPVDLENKPLIQPFEFITKIYGLPKSNELDPTPFLAPFFFLYFGFCVSDVGYGALLVLFSWLALKRLKLGATGVRFFRLFLFCGISTIIAGALTGSWFGNLFDLLAEANKMFLPLKQWKDSLTILDPMQEPTKLLGLALVFGIIQVWFGHIVAAVGNLKNKRYLDILFDQVPLLVFLFGLTGFGLIFLNLLRPERVAVFKYSTLFAALALILTQGRTEKGMGAKLFFGIYNLYSTLSGYLSDILSYSRLWALGMVTGVMASTINLISVQFSQIAVSIVPFFDKISWMRVAVSSVVLIVIFVFGHLVSFLMSLLGAFVHPLRLQFVEFFSKFFKPGGNSFSPFKVETKYINLKEVK